MKFVRQTTKLWALIDIDNKIVAQDLSLDEAIERSLDKYREQLREYLVNYWQEESWEEIQFLAGQLTCCECGRVLDAYNKQWPIGRQRCSVCLAKH